MRLHLKTLKEVYLLLDQLLSSKQERSRRIDKTESLSVYYDRCKQKVWRNKRHTF